MTTKKRFSLNKDTEWWFVQDNTIQVDKNGFRDDLTGEDEYRGLHQELTEQETVDLLNKFYEENKKLQFQVNLLQEQGNEFYRGARENANRVGQLKKENKELKEENGLLKSTIAQLIEQNRKNNDLLLSDIRILEKALWCGDCANDYGRLKELRKEFMR